jgi:hypothetical protein
MAEEEDLSGVGWSLYFKVLCTTVVAIWLSSYSALYLHNVVWWTGLLLLVLVFFASAAKAERLCIP